MNRLSSKLKHLINLTNKRIVFLDLEYLNEALPLNRRPLSNEWKEVVEFGAVKMDFNKGGIEIGTFSEIVNPKIYGPKLDNSYWDKMEEITGLTSDKVKNGKDFMETFKSFKSFANDCQVIVMQGDEDVLRYNLNILKENFDELHYIKLKPILVEYHPLLKHFCSGELYKLIGLSENDVLANSTTHNALFDAKSMALFVKHQLEVA